MLEDKTRNKKQLIKGYLLCMPFVWNVAITLGIDSSCHFVYLDEASCGEFLSCGNLKLAMSLIWCVRHFLFPR